MHGLDKMKCMCSDYSVQPLYKIQGSGTIWIAVGQKGTAVVSHDGGATWEMEEGTTRTKSWLRDMVLNGDRLAWAVGSRGTIVKTDDGARTWQVLSGIALMKTDG